MRDKTGLNIKPHPRPMQMPWLNRSSQNLVLREAMKIPVTLRKHPTAQVSLKKPASDAHPANVATKRSRNTWILPTHEMVDEDCGKDAS